MAWNYADARAEMVGLPIGTDPELVNLVIRKCMNKDMGMNGSAYVEDWRSKRATVLREWDREHRGTKK